MARQPYAWRVAALAFAVAASASIALRGSGGQDAAATFRLDVTVRDNQGKPVGGLDAAQFTVTVDGAPRRVLAARYVYRGPGSEAAARGAVRNATPGLAPLFDPTRAILVVVDETSFPRGGEKTVASITDRLLDRFGPSDQLALTTAPMPPDAVALSFGQDHATIRETIGRIEGRSTAADALARPDEAPIMPVVDPDAAAAAAGSASGGAEAPPAKVIEEPRKEQMGADHALPSNEPREHALETLTRLVAGLRIAPGPKTIVFASAGLADADRSSASARDLLRTAEVEASRARVTIYVLGLPSAGHPVSWSELEQLSAATGGELVRVGRNPDQALDRIGLALSACYQLEVEAVAADRDPRGKAIKVAVARNNTTARAARRVVARADPPFLAVAPAAPTVGAVGAHDLPDESAAPLAKETAKGRRAAPDPDLDAIVARGVEYLTGYFREFRNVVAEEDYVQMNMAVRPPEVRKTKSDFLLVMSPDGKTLVPFRDVFEVDGKAIRDREDRLKKLFLDASPASVVDAATRVQNEGSRYNLVSTKTTVNVPTYPLTYLIDPVIHSFQFRRGREETVEGVRVMRVDYEEVGRPTVIQTPTGMDVVSTGSLWIDPLTGRIVKTYLRAGRAAGPDDQSSLSLEATVTYRRSDALGLWVPAEMRETYRLRGYSTEGRASYSNFRSFQVKTQQEIKIEKK